MSSQAEETVMIDFLILADKAEVINGKLYMMGGGWDRLRVSNPSIPASFSVVIGLLTPWHLTNEPYPISIQLEDEDGTALGGPLEGEMTVGRPPQAVKGQVFRSMRAIQCLPQFPKYGMYRFIASAGRDEQAQKAVSFLVHDGKGSPQPPSSG